MDELSVSSRFQLVSFHDETDTVCLFFSRYPSPAGSYQTLYKSLYEAIRSGNRDALLVKPEESAEVIKVIELGMKASKEGKVLNYE